MDISIMTTDTELEEETTLEREPQDYEFSTGEEGEGQAEGAPSEEGAPSNEPTPPPPAPEQEEASASAPLAAGLTLDQLPISINLHLAPVDGNPAGRSVTLGIRLGQGVPVIYALREADLGGPLPELITTKLEELATTGVLPKSSITTQRPVAPASATSTPAATTAAKATPVPAKKTPAGQLDLLDLFEDL